MRHSKTAGCLLALCFLLNSGCGYVHFGRAQKSDTVLNAENADLRTEKKILQQELAIARKEGEGLRLALQSRNEGREGTEALAKLEATTRELAALRLSYAQLEERFRRSPGGEENLILRDKLAGIEEKLAKSLKESTDLRTEADDLRGQIQDQRRRNQALEKQVADLRTDSERVRGALTQLNQELVAQKQARAEAQQATEALRAQLRAVVAQERNTAGQPQKLSELRENTASAASAMDSSSGLSVKGLKSDGPVTAEIKTSQAKIFGENTPAQPVPRSELPKENLRTHRVASGDTLETIAQKYYGNAERWRWIYAANNALLKGGAPLREGMDLVIPEAAP